MEVRNQFSGDFTEQRFIYQLTVGWMSYSQIRFAICISRGFEINQGIKDVTHQKLDQIIEMDSCVELSVQSARVINCLTMILLVKCLYNVRGEC